MTIGTVNIDIDSILKSIKEENGVDNKDNRIKTLDAIAERAKQYLNEVSTMSNDIVNYIDDQDDLLEEIDKLDEKMELMNENSEKSSNSLENINNRIKELASKKDRTVEEENELDYLYYQQQGYSDKLESNNSNLNDLQSKYSQSKLSFITINQDLQQISENMDQYKNAGQKIQEVANEVGKTNKNCEGTMNRKEGKKVDNYANEMNYQSIGEHTYIDTSSNTYVAEYDVIEGSGKKINGKLNKATVKVFSYGESISYASDDVKAKALEAKRA